MKAVRFHGDAKEHLSGFPEAVRTDIGHQLYRVQLGYEPTDWKPIPAIGPGIREIRCKDHTGIYRAVYLATKAEAVHVYHAFQKKTQRTSKRDLEVAKARYREHMRSLK
jgi:phage-related protein